jgi:DNA-binding NarL/FixJ family response regulator
LQLEGSTNEEIGERLTISPHTVKNHVTAIFRKTGAQSRFDLLKAFNIDRIVTAERMENKADPDRT